MAAAAHNLNGGWIG